MAIEEVDVAIVGAGPAGASTAIGLKKNTAAYCRLR